MTIGYDCFGKEYGVMFRDDLHNKKSIDHYFLQKMILVDVFSKEKLYSEKPYIENMENHELYRFYQCFKKIMIKILFTM